MYSGAQARKVPQYFPRTGINATAIFFGESVVRASLLGGLFVVVFVVTKSGFDVMIGDRALSKIEEETDFWVFTKISTSPPKLKREQDNK